MTETRHRVLLIDDEGHLLNALQKGLIQQGYDVEIAPGGEAAIALFRERPTDVVVTDLMMPGMDGMQTIEGLREVNAEVPVVVATAHATVDTAVRCMKLGAYDYIQKPYRIRDLVELLERAIAERPPPAPASKDAAPAGTTTPKPVDGGEGIRHYIRDIVASIREGTMELPQVPTVLAQLQSLLADPEVDARRVLAILEQDAQIASRVLAVASSAAFSGRGRPSNLKAAITMLGNRTVGGIAQAAAMEKVFRFKSPADDALFREIWHRHITAAMLAREIALDLHHEDPDGVYLAILLHDVGEPFMLRILSEVPPPRGADEDPTEQKLGLMRAWHPHFGAALLKKWGLDDALAVVARHHHDVAAVSGGNLRVRRQVHLAHLTDRILDACGLSHYSAVPDGPELKAAAAVLGFEMEGCEGYRRRAEVLYSELSDKSTQAA